MIKTGRDHWVNPHKVIRAHVIRAHSSAPAHTLALYMTDSSPQYVSAEEARAQGTTFQGIVAAIASAQCSNHQPLDNDVGHGELRGITSFGAVADLKSYIDAKCEEVLAKMRSE